MKYKFQKKFLVLRLFIIKIFCKLIAITKITLLILINKKNIDYQQVKIIFQPKKMKMMKMIIIHQKIMMK